jgi:hypothetical protein
MLVWKPGVYRQVQLDEIADSLNVQPRAMHSFQLSLVDRYAEMSETNCPFRFRAREAIASCNVQRSFSIARRNANKLLAGPVISAPSDTRD